MNRKILLLEPNYKNKYPPIGLMKIATYHRKLGDNVRFFKGDLRDLVVEQLYEDCLLKLLAIDSSYTWTFKAALIKQAIKTGKGELIEKLASYSAYNKLVEECLHEFATNFRKKIYVKFPKWDRIYVTTLFTFYWKITVETIHFAKKLVKYPDQIFLGGVLASLLHDELQQETGIKPMQGLLDKPGLLDDNNIIIDNLPLDYSILEEIDYEYPTQSAYFTFMTKGCTRKCAFCSVPILEPTYKPKIDTIDKFQEINEIYGEQRNLLLMDNNVLASPKFPDIIQEIKDMGFVKGATYVEPNQLEIAVRNLEKSLNDRAYVKKAYRLLHESLARHKNEKKQHFYDVLDKYGLIKEETASKGGILAANEELKESYEKYRNKAPKLRYVDFNQGTDARYVTDELMRLMSEIPIRPLRIAFDYIGLKKQYVNAVELAAKYGIKELSNYILYNFKDKPEDLYNRLLINIQLCKRLNIAIFSFPMKYIPLFGEDAKHREFTGNHWNKKFIRAVQSILNVTKGIVAPGHINEKSSFFEEMFGSTIEEFFEILYMPETYIVYRHLFQHKLEYTSVWRNEFYNFLDSNEQAEARKIIEINDFNNLDDLTSNERIKHFLRHYTIQRGQITQEDQEYTQLKRKYDKLIKTEQYIDLTLTYDFE
ncbi:radical SAM protein [Mucilaginibacter sp.]